MKAMAQIFLSYAREDAEKVEKLYQKLSDAGFKPWMDKKDILPGEKFPSSIRRAIQDSDFFLACLSTNSVTKRGWIQREIRKALDIWQEKLEEDIYLIPIRLDDCKVAESLRDFQWVNLFEENGWTRLVQAIQVGMERRSELIKPKQQRDTGKRSSQGSRVDDSLSESGVGIKLEGDPSEYTSEKLSALVGALAGILDIPRESVRIVGIGRGCTTLRIEMSAEAVNRLISLYEAGDPRIQALGIQQVRVIPATEMTTPEEGPEWVHRWSAQESAKAIARGLGNRLLAQGRWVEAEVAYENAIETGELLHLASAAKASRPVEGPRITALFSGSAYARARLGRYKAAIECLEAGSMRVLSRTLATDQTHLDQADPVDRRAFEMALERWQHTLDTEDERERDKARKALDAAIARIRTNVPEFLAPGGLPFSDIAAAAGVPLIYLATTLKGSLALTVLPNRTDLDDTQVVWLDDFITADLDSLLFERDSDGHITGGYLLARSDGTATLKPILETMLNVLGQQLIGPLARCLRRLGIERGIFVPFGQLSTLPLHAARYEGKNGPCYFLDEFEVTYAPGAWVLARAQAIHPKVAKDKFFSSGSEVAAFTQDEAEAVTHIAAKSPSAPAQIFYEPAATSQLLLNQASASQYLHLAHSIIVDVNDPLQSVVMLPEGATLKLADLLSATRLEGAQLVTLSAMQTALSDFYHFPEAGEAFPASFLEAGVASVVGNLWQVNDLSASLLMKQFYTYHFQGGLVPSAALRRAQHWLREEVTAGLAADVCRRRVESLYAQVTPALAQAVEDWTYYDRLPPNSHPFTHPVYWAAFIISGA